MGALRFVGRLAAAGSQLTTWLTRGSCSSSSGVCGSVLPRAGTPGVFSSGLASVGAAAPAVREGVHGTSPAGCEWGHIEGLGAPVWPQGVSSARSFGGGMQDKRLQGTPALPAEEVKRWLALTPKKRMEKLWTLPSKEQWEFLERLELSGVRPDISLWTSAMYRDPQSRGELEVLAARVEGLWERGYSPDARMYCRLFLACRKQCGLSEGFGFFNDMLARSVRPTRDSVMALAVLLKDAYVGTSSTTLISPFYKATKYVQTLLKCMREWALPIDLPIARALMRVLGGASKWASYDEAIVLVEEIRAAVREQGLQADDELCAAIILCYVSRKADMGTASAVFQSMRSSGETVGPKTYAELIRAYRLREQVNQMTRYVQLAEAEGIVFGRANLAINVDAYSIQGRYKEAEQLFKEAEKGERVDVYSVAAYLRTLSIEGRFKDIVTVTKKHFMLFNRSDSGRGDDPSRVHLVSTLLATLADCPVPNKEALEFICEALDICKSSLADSCSNLLRNSADSSWEAFVSNLSNLNATDPIQAHDLIQQIVDCLWAYGRRGDSVKVVERFVEERNMFHRVMAERTHTLVLDLHGLVLNMGLVMVLLALKRIIKVHKDWRSLPKGLLVITGHGQASKSMRLGVERLLHEYRLLGLKVKPVPGEGGFLIGGSKLTQWVRFVTSSRF